MLPLAVLTLLLPIPQSTRPASGLAGSRPEPRAAAVRSAIHRGLEWLVIHQAQDGRLPAAGFVQRCPEHDPCGGAGAPVHDIGVTALALLALAGDARGAAPGFQEAADRAGRWLVQQQGKDGHIGTGASMAASYHHAIATAALAEVCARRQAGWLREPVAAAAAWIAAARNPGAGWRYAPRSGESDSSITGWMVHALAAAEVAGVPMDPKAAAGALTWFDQVTDPRTGACGYTKRGEGSSRLAETVATFPSVRTEALTALALCSRRALGQDNRDPSGVAECARRTVAGKPPRWENGAVDMYYWWFGTRAMRQAGGEGWTAWRDQLLDAALRHQRQDGHQRGSWDPEDAWGSVGGRVYATALMVLCLEAADG
jgi:hypothetical protein